MEDDQTSGTTEHPSSWASLLEAYREGPKERWSGLLLGWLGPWLSAAKRGLGAVPPYLDADDVAQELAFEVLRIAARWRPGCEDHWIPRRLVERAARRVNKALLREYFTAAERLSEDVPSSERVEADLVLDTPIGKASASDLRVIYRVKVLGEPIEVLAREAAVTPEAMRRRYKAARTRARATISSGDGG